MNSYMVVAKFKPNTNMKDVFAVQAEEMAQVAVLKKEGRLGSLSISVPRQTVFLQVFAPGETEAHETVNTLPMAKWWDLDVYPTPEPARA
jgi:muconolactone delta-isomerase